MMLLNLCAETAKPVVEGDKIKQLWIARVYFVYPVVG